VPRADFYVLPESVTALRFTCGLVERALKEGNSVYVLASSADEASVLNDLLWTFKDISFVPHRLIDDRENVDAPVTIGWDQKLPDTRDVLINLSSALPNAVESFSRVMEPVAPDKAARSAARDRYRDYRERGFELHSHDI